MSTQNERSRYWLPVQLGLVGLSWLLPAALLEILSGKRPDPLYTIGVALLLAGALGGSIAFLANYIDWLSGEKEKPIGFDGPEKMA